ncbi:MAG TPA: glycosyl hydrolase family 28-related protein [Candidatus Hydrogenedentes bacterium]|nr:glycosyl hydrolase family 28-related protein [Candidatus Hydrogenedentota bacterium]HPG69239.1 glycosyl hydrolase family 28-related protein [Candidatus Hydrogenedentota bacterium]
MTVFRNMAIAWVALVLASDVAGAEEGDAAREGAPAAWTTCVTDFGAKADGTGDCTAAFQAALDAAAEKGGIVFAPAGTYLIAGNLSVPQGVVLRGVWEAPHHADIGKGTLLCTTAGKDTEDGPPFIFLHQSSGVRGLTIFYPEQEAPNIHPYPWCIQGMGMHGSVIDVTLVNPYKGIDFGTHPNELHFISGVFGQPLKIGIFVDKCTDIGRIENVHFNPHSWGRAACPTATWETIEYLKQNFVGFLIGKTDWEYMRDCFCIFPKIGYHFVHTQAGDPNVVLTQCGADICPVAVQVDASQGHAGIAFENAQIMGTVIIGPENHGPVKFANSGFWAVETTNEQVIVDGHNTVTLTGCHFNDWGRADAESPCIRIRGGAALIQACDFFHPKKPQIRIEGEAQAVSIVGCRLRGGARIDNACPDAEVQIGLNLNR